MLSLRVQFVAIQPVGLLATVVEVVYAELESDRDFDELSTGLDVCYHMVYEKHNKLLKKIQFKSQDSKATGHRCDIYKS
jgi:hypothetical protein